MIHQSNLSNDVGFVMANYFKQVVIGVKHAELNFFVILTVLNDRGKCLILLQPVNTFYLFCSEELVLCVGVPLHFLNNICSKDAEKPEILGTMPFASNVTWIGRKPSQAT